MAAKAKATPKRPPIVVETEKAADDLLRAWSAESLEARERDDLGGRYLAQRVCDLALDLKAILAEAAA